MLERASIDEETLLESMELQRIGSEAVHAAQEESRRMGVPNVYCINGHIYYELPDGTLSLNDPWQGENTKPE